MTKNELYELAWEHCWESECVYGIINDVFERYKNSITCPICGGNITDRVNIDFNPEDGFMDFTELECEKCKHGFEVTFNFDE